MTPEDYQSIRCQILANLHSAVKGNSTKTLEWLQALSLLEALKLKSGKSPKPASSK